MKERLRNERVTIEVLLVIREFVSFLHEGQVISATDEVIILPNISS